MILRIGNSTNVGQRLYVLSPDGRTLYYGRMTKDGPRIFSHRVGEDPSRDPQPGPEN